MKQGERLGFILIEPREFILTFLAAVRLGTVPDPRYPPMSLGKLDTYVERTARMHGGSCFRYLAVGRSSTLRACLERTSFEKEDR